MSNNSPDLQRIQGGDATLYNSSLDILQRINQLQATAIQASCTRSVEGVQVWRDILAALTREVWSYASKDEREELERVELSEDSFRTNFSTTGALDCAMRDYRKKLDTWERTIRSIIAAHGMGLKATRDKGNMILGGG